MKLSVALNFLKQMWWWITELTAKTSMLWYPQIRSLMTDKSSCNVNEVKIAWVLLFKFKCQVSFTMFFFFIICKGLFLHVIWLTAASFIRTVKKQQHCLLFLLGYWQRRASLIYVLLHIFTSAKVGAKRLRNSSECESGMVDGISLIACYYGAMRVFAFFASTVTHQSPASTKPSTETNIHGEVFLLLKFVLHVTHFLLQRSPWTSFQQLSLILYFAILHF